MTVSGKLGQLWPAAGASEGGLHRPVQNLLLSTVFKTSAVSSFATLSIVEPICEQAQDIPEQLQIAACSHFSQMLQ